MTAVFNLYVSTFVRARNALYVGDDAAVRALCAEVAARNGLASTVSLLAMLDAERRDTPRPRAAVLWDLRHVIGDLRDDAGVDA